MTAILWHCFVMVSFAFLYCCLALGVIKLGEMLDNEFKNMKR